MKKLLLFTFALIGTTSAWGVEVTTAADLTNKCKDGSTTAIEIGTDILDFQGAEIKQNIVIDLQGHTIKCTTAGVSSRAFLISNGSTIEFKSMGSKGSIIASNSSCMSCIRVNNGANVKVSDIIFKLAVSANPGNNNSWMAVNFNNSSATGEIRNCEFITGDGYYGGGIYAGGATVDVYECIFDSKAIPTNHQQQKCGLGVASGGTMTVHSGNYTSNYLACAMVFSSGGTLNIEGGLFKNTCSDHPGTTGTYRRVGTVLNDGDGTKGIINITGGTFEGELFIRSSNNNNRINVTAGSFTVNKIYRDYSTTEDFTSSTTFVLTSGAEFVKEGDNYVAVKKLPLSDDKYVRSVPTSGCGTICLPNNATQPAGVTFYGIVGKDKAIDPTYIVLDTVKTDLEAGTPYIFTGTPSASMQFTLGTKPEYPTATVVNGLIGTLAGVNWDATNSTALKADDETLDGKYLISGGEIKPAEAQGAYLAPNRAYVDLDEVPVVDASAPGRRIYLNSNETTGCDAISAKSAQAQKVMLNGKLYIRRGAQLFDAQGALVK